MTVEVGFGLLVTDDDVVVIVDAHGHCSHDIVAERFLEFRRHEIIARARFGQDGEVDLEPEKIEQKGDYDEAENTSSKMLAECRN